MNAMCKAAGLLAATVVVTVFSPAQQHTGRTQTKTFNVNPVVGARLVVSVNGGAIHVRPWGVVGQVEVDVFGGEDDNLEDLRMGLTGSTVRVENYGDESDDETRYEISVPTNIDVDLRTSNGLISVEGALTGSVNGSTSAGDIRIGDVTGDVDMKTSGGDVRAHSVKGNLTLGTSGGDIVAGDVSGETDVRTSGGDIRLGNVKKKLWAKTSGGNITVGDVGGEAAVSTSGGNVIVGKVSGSASVTTAGGDIDLEGATGSVTAKTAGGNLRLLNITGTVDAKTAGGDVVAELNPSGKGGNRLATASGNIRLSIPASAKATIDARIRVHGRWKSSQKDYAIRSDFESKSYEYDDDAHEIHATYLLNGGGETISLETVNADISIRKTVSR